MTCHLPPNLLALFAPRPPLPFMAPPEKKAPPPLSGLGNYLSKFETTPTSQTQAETPTDRKLRIKAEKEEKKKKELEDKLSRWDPKKDPNIIGDPHHVLFVGRLSYNITEHKLRREFETYGPVKKIRIVTDKQGKPRGYAFIEFEKEKDMKAAYYAADGKKIEGRRVVVDQERGRLMKGWKPRSLAGGAGFTRKGGEEVNQKFSGREDQLERDRRSLSPVPSAIKKEKESSSRKDKDESDRSRRDSHPPRGSYQRRHDERDRMSDHSHHHHRSEHHSSRSSMDRSSSSRRERERERSERK
jgi:U1 small nuclear ribonucleoprotein